MNFNLIFKVKADFVLGHEIDMPSCISCSFQFYLHGSKFINLLITACFDLLSQIGGQKVQYLI